MENVDACQLCYEVYDEETRRPRVLPCGHSYCTDCITKLIMNGRLSCPECSANFIASDSSQIPVNYGMERFISAMKEKQLGTICKLQSLDKIRTMHDIIGSHKSSALSLLLSSEAMERQLSDYIDFLQKSIKSHKELAAKLQSTVIWHESIVKQMTEEQEKTKETQKQVIIYSKNMRANLPELDCADSNKAVSIAVAKVIETFCDLASCLRNCQSKLPNLRIALAQRTLMKSEAVLHEEDSNNEEDFYASVLSSRYFTILEKITLCSNGKMSFTVDQLKSDQDAWRERIKSGRVFAVSSVDGRNRSASLSMKDGQVYLHCLKNEEAPLSSYIIEHSEIANCNGKASTVAFFDLEWDGSTKGRIHILMPSTTPLAQHFRAVCTGELGLTYINKKLCRSNDISIICESYHDNSTDNSTIGSLSQLGLINLNDDLYKCLPETGTIWMNKNGSFQIVTGSVDGSNRYVRVFGKVKDENMMLSKVAKRLLNGFKDIKIVESGVVLQI